LTAIRPTDRIVLACSGDLATSVAIPWLASRYGAEIVTVTLDVGQAERLDDVRERALAAGASRAHVIDAREELARDFLLPALHAGILDEGDGFAVTLGRLLVARHLVTMAALERAVAVAHGLDVDAETASFARTIRSLNPTLRVIAPARDWRLTRAAQIAYARERDMPVLEPVERPTPTSTNLWGRSLAIAGAAAATRVPRPARKPDRAASVAIRFDRGVPVALNDVDLPVVDLIGTLATIGGAHGVGLDAPAGAILRAASRDLRSAALPAATRRRLSGLASRGANLAARGRWFTPARDNLSAALTDVRDRLSGTIRVELSNGTCRVVDREVAAPPAPEIAGEATIAPMVPHRIAPARA